MIEIVDWRSDIGKSFESNYEKVYDVTFTGEEKLDERSDWSSTYITRVSKSIVFVSYSHESAMLSLGGRLVSLRNLESVSYVGKRILVDSTTLAVPELLHIFSILNMCELEFDVLYVQPEGYKSNTERKGLDQVESYALSDDGVGPQQLPPFVSYTTNAALCVCLGFEGHRFGALVHSEEYQTSGMICVLGVPAFQCGWENKALANNFRIMGDAVGGVEYKFAGANDPLRTYEVLTTAHKSARYLNKTLCLAPFGTKPAAIAIALFAVNHTDVVVIYDFVRRRKERSTGTDVVHLWSVGQIKV